MHDSLTLYKLIILYMLRWADFPLTKSQISEFILEKEYTNFLTLQQTIGELIDAGLVLAHSTHSRTHLSLTDEGAETLAFFGNQINPSIKTDINDFFRENEIKLRNEASIVADYYKSASGEYEAHLTAKDKGINLIDMTLSVPLEETAASICDNWQRKNQEIYQYLIGQLF